MPLAPKVCEQVDEIELLWFLDGSAFDPAYSAVPVTRYAKVNWTGIAFLDVWFPYSWETGQAFNLPGRSHDIIAWAWHGRWCSSRSSSSARLQCTSCCRRAAFDEWGSLEGFSFLIVIQAGPLKWLVETHGRISFRHILMRNMVAIGTLLMCLLTFVSTFVPVFLKTLRPFVGVGQWVSQTIWYSRILSSL